MLKTYRLGLIFFLLAMASGLGAFSINSYVDKLGLLHEPFALIALSWLFAALGIVSTLYAFLKQFFKH
jgi:hypothetical protein